MKLPGIEDKTMLRPGGDKHHIPNPEYGEFWQAFYEFLLKNFTLSCPLTGDISGRINPYFGNFGFRFQATTKTARYFHLGLDINAKSKTPVQPIASGVLEYSGFGHINGNYVFLSHPDIRTEDGFVLHSLYLHLRSLDVGFNSYQKMLRKISFNKHPNILIAADQKIGEVGSTGNISGIHSHLHLQVEFRNESGKIVVIDPARIFKLAPQENLTATVENEAEFKEIFSRKSLELKKMGIDKYWKL